MIHSFSRAALTLLGCMALLGPARADSVTGQVVNNGGVGIAGVTVEFDNGASTVTGPGGLFAISVAAGTYDIDFLPPTSALAPVQLKNVVVSGFLNLGQVTLLPGFALTGTVLTTLGLPVVGADIDVYEQTTRQKLFTPNDNTDSLGRFLVIVPAGTYRVRATPPAGQLLVAEEVENVVVNGPTSAGTIRLGPGVLVTGRVVDAQSGLGIANTDLDAEDAISGKAIVTPNDDTDPFGNYSLILPATLLHLSFDPAPGDNHLGLEEFNVLINGPVNRGNTRLSLGLALSGTVRGPGGVPIAGADIDVDSAVFNQKIYTPNDNTDSNGNFRVIVPAGSYRVSVQPPFSSGAVGTRTGVLNVQTATALPTFNLPGGVALTGTLLAHNGVPEHGADVDVTNPTTGAMVVTGPDNTDVNGKFAVIVPAGTWDIRFQTRKFSASRVRTLKGVNVPGATTLNHQLSIAPVVTYLGSIGIPTVPQGGPIPITLAFVNLTAVTQTCNLSFVIIDPAGGETPLLTPFPLPLGPGQVAVAVNIPLFLPPVSPAHLGKPFRMEVRFDDPVTGEEHDHDSFKYFVQ